MRAIARITAWCYRRIEMQRWLFILMMASSLAISQAAPVTELPWSFKPLSVQPLPKNKQSEWPKSRLDHFILSRIESNSPRQFDNARRMWHISEL